MTNEGIDEAQDKRANNDQYNLILTAYLDGSGSLNFHGGKCFEDFGDEIHEAFKVLRRFYIRGKIVDESGLTEPIRVT